MAVDASELQQLIKERQSQTSVSKQYDALFSNNQRLQIDRLIEGKRKSEKNPNAEWIIASIKDLRSSSSKRPSSTESKELQVILKRQSKVQSAPKSVKKEKEQDKPAEKPKQKEIPKEVKTKEETASPVPAGERIDLNDKPKVKKASNGDTRGNSSKVREPAGHAAKVQIPDNVVPQRPPWHHDAGMFPDTLLPQHRAQPAFSKEPPIVEHGPQLHHDAPPVPPKPQGQHHEPFPMQDDLFPELDERDNTFPNPGPIPHFQAAPQQQPLHQHAQNKSVPVHNPQKGVPPPPPPHPSHSMHQGPHFTDFQQPRGPQIIGNEFHDHGVQDKQRRGKPPPLFEQSAPLDDFGPITSDDDGSADLSGFSHDSAAYTSPLSTPTSGASSFARGKQRRDAARGPKPEKRGRNRGGGRQRSRSRSRTKRIPADDPDDDVAEVMASHKRQGQESRYRRERPAFLERSATSPVLDRALYKPRRSMTAREKLDEDYIQNMEKIRMKEELRLEEIRREEELYEQEAARERRRRERRGPLRSPLYRRGSMLYDDDVLHDGYF